MGRTINTVKEVISGYVNVHSDEIKDDDNLLDDLGLDSLDSIELVLQIEEKLGVELNDDDLENVKTVQALSDTLDRKLAR